MKKLLIGIIIILILILTGITIVNGIEVGSLKVLGILQIKAQNEELDAQIQNATKLASTDYPKKLDDLDSVVEEFEKTKKNYEDMVSVSTDSEIQAANQYGVYEIGTLWIKLGNHAKSEGVRMDVSARNLTMVDVNSSIEADRRYNCNLDFTVTGTYAGIAGFIEDIEDDSTLGFRIENFSMVASSEGTNILQATFTCNDIIIRGVSSSSTTVDTNNMTSGATNNTNANTANNTDGNTTNNTNTENTTVDNSTVDGNNTVQ